MKFKYRFDFNTIVLKGYDIYKYIFGLKYKFIQILGVLGFWGFGVLGF